MTENKRQELEELIRNEGIAIFVKGKMVIGIHPDNVENNTKLLNSGDMKIDWELLVQRVNELENRVDYLEEKERDR
jgi:hypothetical protein